MSVHSPINFLRQSFMQSNQEVGVKMEDQSSWEDLSELPTKFNKYRRILARNQQQEQHQEQCQQQEYKVDVKLRDRESLVTERSHALNGRSLNQQPCPVYAYNHLNLNTQRSFSDSNCYSSDVPLNLTVPSARETNSRPSSQTRLASNNCQPIYSEDSCVVDDHFQRSLGSVYRTLQLNTNNSSHSSSHTHCSADVKNVKINGDSVTVLGDVDDHFSKSLGELWTRVKSTTVPAAHMDCGDSSSPADVDDHFAKALGPAWYQMQSSRGSSPNSRGNSPSVSTTCASFVVKPCHSPQRLQHVSSPR